MVKILVISFVIFLFSNSLNAMSVKTYEEMMSSNNSSDVLVVKTYVFGLGEGFTMSNTVLLGRKQESLFCPPENLPLNADNFIDILNKTIDRYKNAGKNISEMPILILLFRGLETTFPCSK